MKKVLSIILFLSLIFCSFPVTSLAVENNEVEQDTGYLLNYHEVDFPVERSISSEQMLAESKSLMKVAAKQTVPSSYSSVSNGNIMPAKNQGKYGSCWACSATSAAEASFKVNDGVSTDLSTLQLAYFFYNKKYDPLGNASGDSTNALKNNCLKAGGSNAFTMFSLAGWTNATAENDLPYTTSNCTAAEKGKISENYAYKYNIAHLQNAYILPYTESGTDIENIKKAIMKYGSVCCSYDHLDEYYDEDYCSYYCNEESTNHAVSIVGWNDSFSKENFNSSFSSEDLKPAKNGAWLVKNSWGTSWGTDGDQYPSLKKSAGYFWLSYYDKSIISSKKVFVYDYTSSEHYKYNYQYDGSCGNKAYIIPASYKVGAIYEVKGLTADSERIEAAGIALSSADVTGKVYIYKDPSDGKPASGKLVASEDFATTYPGFYTIKLSNPTELKKGQKYSVVFKFDEETSVYFDKSYTNGDWIEFNANTTNDKTYWFTSSSVTDLAKKDITARIKAYTNDVKKTYNVKLNLNYEGGGSSYLYKEEGTALKLESEIPQREGYNFLGWAYNPDADTPDFKAGDFYTVDEDAELYGIWKRFAAESVFISPDDIELTVNGESKVVTLSAIPEDSVCDWVVANGLQEGNSYEYGGILLTKKENTFSLFATENAYENVSIYFYDTISGEYAVCSVTVKPEIATSLSISDTSLNLDLKGIGKTVTVTPQNTNAVCDWAVKDAEYNNGKFYLNGLEITNTGNSFYIQSLYKTSPKVNVVFFDKRSQLETECEVTITKAANIYALVELRKELLKTACDFDLFKEELDINDDSRVDLLDLVTMKKIIADNQNVNQN